MKLELIVIQRFLGFGAEAVKNPGKNFEPGFVGLGFRVLGSSHSRPCK